jgi:hypothetical protein
MDLYERTGWMEPFTIEIYRHRVETDKYRKILKIETNLGVMFLNHEQKLYKDYGLLYVGLEDTLPLIKLPANPDVNRGPMTLKGFTNDPGVVALFEKHVL